MMPKVFPVSAGSRPVHSSRSCCPLAGAHAAVESDHLTVEGDGRADHVLGDATEVDAGHPEHRDPSALGRLAVDVVDADPGLDDQA